ncbi:HAD-IA family hydrolase [Oceanicoccus sp. KOV_DT_Chl]|uniref:HAD-IA family hydrolase n=1 Tax=Oceanicoccus sp. KOV_DT_Chl TaxID=1904639 RepID=UPI000C7ABA29|nr:HAD-IA family hydrolase [Oceanicoccus sp. KOV_DT_Chl]
MLIIFDWDGTLIDSTAKIIGSMQLAIAELGLPPIADDAVKGIIGLGLPEAVATLYPGTDVARLDQLRSSYSQYFIAADRVPCHFYPDVERVLDHLRDKGHQLAVATGKSRNGLNRVLSNLQLTDYFDASRCADETASKPDPLMLHQLLAELNYDAGAAVMVGDTAFDLEMAANAGVASVGVSYGAHPVDRLLLHKPRRIIDRFEQLLECID